MRYDTLVLFNQKTNSAYDPTKGKYDVSLNQIGRWCSVSDLTVNQSFEIYGRSNIGAIQIHYRGDPVVADTLTCKNKTYTITSTTTARTKVIQYATEGKV